MFMRTGLFVAQWYKYTIFAPLAFVVIRAFPSVYYHYTPYGITLYGVYLFLIFLIFLIKHIPITKYN